MEHRSRVVRRRVVRRRRRKTSHWGAVVRCLGFLILVVLCVLGARWLGQETHSTFYVENDHPSKVPSLSTLGSLRPDRIQSRNRRVVYPYSVVPGGVRSAEELHTAADDDPLVAAHYSGFDYQHARILEVRQPKLVYLSYRKDGHIYWTSKQASLHVGEKLLTDGHITARTRCGNQVSVLPQSETSPHEPMMAELDRPDAVASGSEQLFPSEVATNQLEADPGAPLSSMGGGMFPGGPPPGGFMPVPLGGGGVGVPITCPPNKKNKTNNSKDCKHNPPPPPPPPVVPEPGTLVLMLSGVTALAARYRFSKN